jgi:hypothetical protein
MSRITVKARKLADPRVQYISLVDRGANRIPFRIIKRQQENDMIDIGRIFKSGDKAAKTTPTSVLAIAVEKREDMEPVRTALKDAGFNVDTEVERDDGTILFQQVEKFEEADAKIYKVSGDVIALLDGSLVQKAEEKGFVKDLFGSLGYVPSMDEACAAVCKSVLTESVNATEDNFEQFQTMMKADFSDLADYIGETLTSVPEALLSLELPAVVVKAEEEPKPVIKADDEGEPAPVKKADDEVEPAAAAAVDLAPVLSQLTDLATVVKGVADAVKATQDDLTLVKDGQSALADKVGEVEEVAKAANEAVGGTIVGGEPAGDAEPTSRIPIQKGDDDPREGLFDTAFLPGAKH